MSASATLRVSKSKFERNTECKSETLGFMGLYWVELSVCIIPQIIYNLLPPWTYPVLGNHVNLLVCVFYLCLLTVQYAQQYLLFLLYMYLCHIVLHVLISFSHYVLLNLVHMKL